MSNFTEIEDGRAVVMGMQSLKRVGTPADVTSVIAYRVSGEARWITGDIVAVDGGSKPRKAAKFLSLGDRAQHEHLHRRFRATKRDGDAEKSYPALGVQCCPELK